LNLPRPLSGLAKIATLCLVVAAACRPALPGEASPSPSQIAGELVPSEPMSVLVHIPGPGGALYAPLLAIEGSDLLTSSGVSVYYSAPFPGEDPFLSSEDPTSLDLYLADAAAGLEARAQGADLVAVAVYQRSSDWMFIAPKKGAPASVADLTGNILVQGYAGDGATVAAAVTAAGGDASAVTTEPFFDLMSPWDPTPLFDGTYPAALVRPWDGYIRATQGYSPITGKVIGKKGLATYDVRAQDAAQPTGLLLWAHAADLAVADKQIAGALALIGIAVGLAECRDSATDCAGITLASGIADQDEETLTWAIDQLNASIWPTSEGLFALSEPALQAAADEAAAGGVEAGELATWIDATLLDLASLHWPEGLDLTGTSWQPLELPLPTIAP
jgi:hypothetical protein